MYVFCGNEQFSYESSHLVYLELGLPFQISSQSYHAPLALLRSFESRNLSGEKSTYGMAVALKKRYFIRL